MECVGVISRVACYRAGIVIDAGYNLCAFFPFAACGFYTGACAAGAAKEVDVE
jgi:hypothetical protein